MTAPNRDGLYFGIGMYVWTAKLWLWVLLVLSGCAIGDNLSPPDPPLPRIAPCTLFEADILPASSDLVVPSIAPAPLGVRIVVESHYDPFMGSSAPVPGGRMVWNVWVYHWYDGDHLGAIGRVPEAAGDPRGGMCQWYEPL